MNNFEEQPKRPQIIEEEAEDINKPEEMDKPEEQPTEKTRAQIAEEELEKMRKDKLIEEAEEEYKEQSGDYKVAYDQYLKEKDSQQEANPQKTPEVAPEVDKPDQVKPKTPEVAPEPGKPEQKPEPAKTPEEKNSVNSEEAPEGAPFQAKRREEELKEKENVPFQKEDNGEVSLVEKQILIDAYKNLSKIAKQKEGLKGLLSKFGIGKNNSEIEKEYIEAQKVYNQAIDKIKGKTGEERYEIEEKYVGVERENKEERFESIKNLLKKKKEDISKKIEGLDPEKKGLLTACKNLLKNKKFQYVVGAAVLGVSIWAPPVGFLNAFGLPGILPAILGPYAKALGAAGGAWMARGGLEGFKKEGAKEEVANEIDLTENSKKPDYYDNNKAIS